MLTCSRQAQLGLRVCVMRCLCEKSPEYIHAVPLVACYGRCGRQLVCCSTETHTTSCVQTFCQKSSYKQPHSSTSFHSFQLSSTLPTNRLQTRCSTTHATAGSAAVHNTTLRSPPLRVSTYAQPTTPTHSYFSTPIDNIATAKARRNRQRFQNHVEDKDLTARLLKEAAARVGKPPPRRTDTCSPHSSAAVPPSHQGAVTHYLSPQAEVLLACTSLPDSPLPSAAPTLAAQASLSDEDASLSGAVVAKGSGSS